MSNRQDIRRALDKLVFQNRETGYHHHSHSDDILQYELMRQGDMLAVDIGRRMFRSANTGCLSPDPMRNAMYLFVASATLASRFCISGGMPSEMAYNISDVYIRTADECRSLEELYQLRDDMMRDYTSRMREIGKQNVYSRPVLRCMDYVDQHLQQPLSVDLLAEKLDLSSSYLSTLFKRETGTALSEYIRKKRIDAAKALLQYSEFSLAEIAEYLCFSSNSHFTHTFRRYVGMLPSEFRKQAEQALWQEE